MRTLLFFAAASIAAALQAAGPVDRGRELFTRQWQPQTPTKTQGDGLGPLFNARSCVECHKQGGVGGAGPNENNVQLISVGLVDFAGFREPEAMRTHWFPHADGGVMVLHRKATFAGYDLLRRQRLKWASPQHPEVVNLPLAATPEWSGRFCMCGSGLSPLNPFEERNTPALFGAGLLDGIALATLEEVAERQSPEVRGRPARLPGGEVGRFGWKGQNATLLGFCENACAVELGLETSRRKQTPRPFVRREPPKSPGTTFHYIGPTPPDVTDREIAEMTAFVASLSPPTRITPPRATAEDVAIGEFMFQKIGCAECHTPNLGEVRGVYSDLLLHSVGTSGSVYYAERSPPADLVGGERIVPVAAGEFRTPPLWGVADSAPYLHDGSADTLGAAIEAHAVQARRSVEQFCNLDREDHRRVLAFLGSLRAPTALR
jgi:CxxC motif-containing protein (DUF1111 family)